MAEYDLDLANIVNGIKHEIHMQMVNLIPAAKTSFAQGAKNYVLDYYIPTKYKRRTENGPYEGTTGIGDTESYDVAVDPQELSMTVMSNVTGNPRYSVGTDGWNSGNITEIIESGRGYNWKRSEIYALQIPRPWMERSGDEFVENVLTEFIDMALKNYLGTDSTTVGG